MSLRRVFLSADFPGPVGSAPLLPCVAVLVVGFWAPVCAQPTEIPAHRAPPITALALSPDGRSLAVGSQAGLTVRVWPSCELQDKLRDTLPTELDHVHALQWSPDGRFLAAAGGTPAVLGGVEVYRWPVRKRIASHTPHDDVAYAVAWCNDSGGWLLASADGQWTRQSLTDKEPDLRVAAHPKGTTGIAHLGRDAGILTAGADQTLRLWNATDGSPQRSLTLHTDAVLALAVRPALTDQPLPWAASAGADRTVRFWQPTIGRMLRFARLPSEANALAWSPDGTRLWAACRDGRVRGVDPQTARIVCDLPALSGPAYCLVLGSAGEAAVGGAGGELRRLLLAEP
jgi:WD40 repeat protein